MRQALEAILAQRIMILDGGMGTQIQAYHLTEKEFRGSRFDKRGILLQGNNDLLSLTQPEIISAIHYSYLDANSHGQFNKSLADFVAPKETGIRDYIGIRPAPGYPACPDHTEKALLFDLLKPTENIGILLTESFAMFPASSVCGYYYSHPQSRYFALGKIDADQRENNIQRKGGDSELLRKHLEVIV